MRCPLCHNHLPEPAFVHRLPTTMNRVFASPERARRAAQGDVALSQCAHCGLVTNTAFDPDLVLEHFDAAYDCAQHHSLAWRARVGAQLDAILARVSLASVCEIGSGSGWTLEAWRARGRTTSGFDPTYRGPDASILPRPYVAGERLPCDLIYIQHVLDELPALSTMLTGLRRSAPNAHLFFEVLDASSTLLAGHVWDIAYERCHYFPVETLLGAFEGARRMPGPNAYLEVLTTTAALRPHPGVTTQPKLRLELGLERLRAAFDALPRRPIYLWGASNRGGNVAHLVSGVTALLDVNPAKQGGYLPGTGHEILAPAQLGAREPGAIVVTNPAYLDEIRCEVRARLGPEWSVMSLLSMWDAP